jgi:hypothetical protein
MIIIKRIITQIIVVVIIAAGIDTFLPRPASSKTPPSLPSRNEDSPFGFHPAGPLYNEANNIGIRWTRTDRYLFWTFVDPNKTGDPAQFQWKGTAEGPNGKPVAFDYDVFLSEAHKAGLNILQNISLSIKQEDLLQFNKTAFENFVKAAVKRYPFVRYWQVGNEPNDNLPNEDIAKKSMYAYADMLRVTYEAIKEADPNAQVLIAGLGGDMSMDDINSKYYNLVLSALGGRYFDAFDIHFYGTAKGGVSDGNPRHRILNYRDFKTVYDYFRYLLDKNDFSRVPIWVTEMGTFSGRVRSSPNAPFNYQTEAEQARDLLKRWVYPLSLGVKKVFWAYGLAEAKYTDWDDGFFAHTGLIYIKGKGGIYQAGDKKLGYYTYKKMTETLEGSDWNSIQTIHEFDGVYIYKFIKNGKNIWVAWNDNAEEKEVTIHNISSNQVTITDAVPKYESGKQVTDYKTAFKTEIRTVSGGKTTITLKDNPVFVIQK